MMIQTSAVQRFDEDLSQGNVDLAQFSQPLSNEELSEILTSVGFGWEIDEILAAAARFVIGEGEDLTLSQITAALRPATIRDIKEAVVRHTEREAYQRGVAHYQAALDDYRQALCG